MAKQQSKSFILFQQTLKRAAFLIDHHDDLPTHNINLQNSSDLVRSAVVLSVAAMDAFFTKRFIEIVIPYIKKRGASKDMIDFLSRAGLDTEQALIMITMERPYRRLRTIVQSHLETFTTQRFHVIDELFRLIGLPQLSKNAEQKANRNQLLNSVQKLVERRHAIVHDGDYNKHNKLQRIDSEQTKKRILDLLTFVMSAEEIILNRTQKHS